MKVNVITDGSFKDEKAGYAFWISSPVGRFKKYGRLKNAKNSTEAEMQAIANALYFIRNHKDLWGISKITIQTDSEHSINMITDPSNHLKGKKKRQENFRKIRGVITELIGKYNGVKSEYEFKHVKAHSGTDTKRKYVHDWCDKFAKKGRELKIK